MDPMMRRHRNMPQMRLCGGCGTEWYSEVHLSEEVVDCQLCGSPLVGVSRPASEIDLVFGPFLWRADEPSAA
jgi:hypothetical protein